VHGGQTHQNVRNNQSYTFLKSPAMVAEGHAVANGFDELGVIGRGIEPWLARRMCLGAEFKDWRECRFQLQVDG